MNRGRALALLGLLVVAAWGCDDSAPGSVGQDDARTTDGGSSPDGAPADGPGADGPADAGPDPDAADPDAAADAAVADTGDPDAAVVDAAADAADPDAVLLDIGATDAAPDAALPDMGAVDAGDLDRGADAEADAGDLDQGADAEADAGADAAPPPVLAKSCGQHAPVLLYDRLIVVDDNGMRLSSLLDDDDELAVAWPEGFAPRQPLARPAAQADAELFVTLVGEAGCRVDAFTNAGAPVWSTPLDGVDCTAPAAGPSALLVSISAADGPRVLRLRLADGEIDGNLALPEGAPTAPVLVSIDENSGSHWLVGVGDQLVAFGDDNLRLAPEGQFDAGMTVTQLGVTEGQFAAALGYLGLPPVADLGDRVGAYQLGEDGWAPRGDLVVLPGGAHAGPQIVFDCIAANSGSHWWCNDGLVVAGGEGWIGAWDLDLAEHFIERLDDPGLRVTGLAVGGDGKIYNSGSHWLPGDWRFRAVGEGGEVEAILAGDGAPETCVTSPVIDTDGTAYFNLDAPALSDPFSVQTQAGGLAAGWARAGGNNQGAGGVDPSGTCPGGERVLYNKTYVEGAGVTAWSLTLADDGDLIVGGVRLVEPDTLAWAARFTRGGRLRWSRTFGPDNDGARVATVGGDQYLVGHQQNGSFAWNVIDGDGDVAGSAIDGDLRGKDLRDATSVPGGGAALLGRYGDDQLPDHWIFPFDPAGAPQGAIDLQDSGGAFSAERFVADGAGYIIGGRRDAFAVVRAIDAAGAERWTQVFGGGDGDQTVVDVAVGPGGRIYALLARQVLEETESALLVLAAADGGPIGVSDVLPLAPVALTNTPNGPVMLAEDHVRVPFTVDGAIGLPSGHGREGGVQRGNDIAGTPEGDVVVVGIVGEDEANLGVRLALVDPWGNDACGDAGKCVGVAVCDDADPCTADFCDAATGECGVEPLPEGVSCGPNLTCQGGDCLPR